MLLSGISPLGRIATSLGTLFMPPYYGRKQAAQLTKKGYISPQAKLNCEELKLGYHVFIDDRVLIYQGENGGQVEIGTGAHIYRDTIIQTGDKGTVTIGADTHIQPRCQFSAYKANIRIGSRVQIAPNCSFYPYNHGIAPSVPISKQPLESKGDIIIEDDTWISVGVIVLDGVTIGKGAVIGAGAVVTKDIPDNAIAIGIPARVVDRR